MTDKRCPQLLFLLTACSLLAAPLLAQTTETDLIPGYGGTYTASTYGSDGSLATSDILPGYGGTYTAYTTNLIPAHPAFTPETYTPVPLPASAFDSPSQDNATGPSVAPFSADADYTTVIDAGRRAAQEINAAYSMPERLGYVQPMNYATHPHGGRPTRVTTRRAASRQISIVKLPCSKAAVDAWFKADAQLMASNARSGEMRSMRPLTCGHLQPQRP